MPKTQEEMSNIFTYHAPKCDQADRYEQIRIKAKEFGNLINQLCPDSREKSVAFTNLETACFWANASIARNE